MSRIVGSFLLFIICYTMFFLPSLDALEDKTIDLYLEDVGIREVLNTLIKLVNKNIIIHESVEGTISLNLSQVTFLEAMDLITKVSNLAYYQERDTFVVGPMEIIETSFQVRIQKIYFLENLEVSQVKSILEPLFPDLSIHEDTATNMIIFHGLPEDIQRAIDIVEVFDKEEVEEEEIEEEKKLVVQPIKNADPEIILKTLLLYFPDVNLYYEETTSSLIIDGTEQQIEIVLEIIEGLDREPDIEEVVLEEDTIIETVPLDYADIAATSSILASVFPDLQIETYEKKDRLILIGTPTTIEMAKVLIKSVDAQKSQVLIDLQIEEISLTGREELGIPDFNDITFFAIEDRSIKAEFPSLLRMLQEKGSSDTLARPRLTAVHGEQASLLLGDEIPYLVTTYERDEDGRVFETQVLEILDAGITLDFLPRITEDDIITLQINTEISSFVDIGREFPQITTRRAETTARLKDGESIIIGGLIKDSEIENLSKVPFLGELPLLGELFQRKTFTRDKSETIIILTVHIIEEKTHELEEDEVYEEVLEDD